MSSHGTCLGEALSWASLLRLSAARAGDGKLQPHRGREQRGVTSTVSLC